MAKTGSMTCPHMSGGQSCSVCIELAIYKACWTSVEEALSEEMPNVGRFLKMVMKDTKRILLEEPTDAVQKDEGSARPDAGSSQCDDVERERPD